MAATTWSTTDKSASMTLSGGNLIATASAGAVSVRGKDPKRTGKYYIEYLSTTTQGGSTGLGFGTAATPLSSNAYVQAFIIQASGGFNFAYNSFGAQISSGNQSSGITTSTLLCAAIDLDNGLVWVRMSAAGVWNNNVANNPATGVGGISLNGTGLGQGIDVYPLAFLNTTGNSITANFGATAFTGAVPSGFTSGWDDSVAIVTNVVATQAGVEEWASGAPAVQATQVGIEQWGRSANPGIVTQVSVEHWAAASPDAAITQALIEHWGTVSTIATQAVVTQVAVEHWITEAAVSTARRRRVVCVSG